MLKPAKVPRSTHRLRHFTPNLACVCVGHPLSFRRKFIFMGTACMIQPFAKTLLPAFLTVLLVGPSMAHAQVAPPPTMLRFLDEPADATEAPALDENLSPEPPADPVFDRSEPPADSVFDRSEPPFATPSTADDLTFPTPIPEETSTNFAPSVSNTEQFEGSFSNSASPFKVGIDLYSPPDFEGGLIVVGKDIALKIGGYVKADFIYDFDPIDSTDSFVTTSIPVGAPPRTNARFHAKQSRISFDTRWASDKDTVRIFVEGDFFTTGNQYRLRHAYGETGSILVGQTWTTFTDVSAAPATLDFEGSVSAVNRRQAQARWTSRLYHDDVAVAVAIEDARFIIEVPEGIEGEPRSPSPDFVAHIRYERPWGRIQMAHLFRIGGFQPENSDVLTSPAWGFNFTGAFPIGKKSKCYSQIVFGEGIGSYRGLPDAVPASDTTEELLGLFGWMVGATHAWNDRLSSNFTYAENSLDNPAFQNGNAVHRTTYLSANLIWNPVERVNVGIEYLYGLRENVGGAVGSANRVQAAFIFDLP